MRRARALLIWAALAAALAVPIAVAAASPLLAWRDPVYIAAGFAGVVGMALLLVQPLLAGGYLPGLSPRRGRILHGWVGTALVAAVALHVAGLWLTSPPDVIDALLFRSPTPFSLWGVVAMWAVIAAALAAGFRRRLRLRPPVWRLFHLTFAAVIVVCSVVHAMLIEGTMGAVSKAVLCILVVAATLKVAADLKQRTVLPRRKA
ncbi:ferric reductase-like transmembrane domain-containing protein [Acuticoccus sp. MNP-M23]|uniref:ferric reductase-like transmembrane domain-containing protein n=1 Tax=Acuticoccus sp. MNP-M23 TaxID=3072793 RepID=UPI0028152C35|nr:ferric reductase-like transmembrane domain-containing protein [Acuticoccus sp. MNP-M23]WMS40769.1 ferric reductase-like transmembrane domain-containing protein [Acuticoccus sp. MNP-M23]